MYYRNCTVRFIPDRYISKVLLTGVGDYHRDDDELPLVLFGLSERLLLSRKWLETGGQDILER